MEYVDIIDNGKTSYTAVGCEIQYACAPSLQLDKLITDILNTLVLWNELVTRKIRMDTRVIKPDLRQKVEVIIHRDGKFCLCSPNKKRNFWTLPGGGIDRGETLFEAASRECLEEVGILIKDIKDMNFSRCFYGNIKKAVKEGYKGTQNYFVLSEYCKTDTSIFNRGGDGREFQWLTLREANRVLDANPFSLARLEALNRAYAVVY